MTNADKIRAMSDEDLSKIIDCPRQGDPDWPYAACYGAADACDQCCLEWLQAEAD